MNLTNLIDAMHGYERLKAAVDPDRYFGLELFRQYFPDLFLTEGPPPLRLKASPSQMAAFQKLLAGEELDGTLCWDAFQVTPNELKRMFAASDPVRKQTPAKTVILTFDDACRDQYEVAAPILERYGFNAVFFVAELQPGWMGSPGFGNKDEYMTWQQIKDLSDRGFEIANHTLNHNTFFTRATDEQIVSEVRGIEERCAEYEIPKPTAIGYPCGPCNEHSVELVRSLGYRWGRGSAIDGSPIRCDSAFYEPHFDNPMEVPSVFVHGVESLEKALERCVSGKAMNLVFHSVRDEDMLAESGMEFSEMMEVLHDSGATCMSFRDLGQYVDPEVAWGYTHPATSCA